MDGELPLDLSAPVVRWRDTRRMDASLIYKIAVWRGWLCSPSMHMFIGRCTYHHKHPKGTRPHG